MISLLLTRLPVCLLSLSSAPELWPLPLLQPNLWLQLVPCSPEVRGAIRVIQTLMQNICNLQLYVLCLPGVQTAWIDTDKIGWTLTAQKRCEWTSRVNIRPSLHPLLTILIRYTRAEQKCNLWRLCQRWQLHCLPGNTGDGGDDSSVKQLWGWGWVIFLHALLNIIKILMLIKKKNPFGSSDDSKNPTFKTSGAGLKVCGSATWECVFDIMKYDICLQCRGVDRFFPQWLVWQHRSDSRCSSRIGFAPRFDCCSSLHQLSFHFCVRILSDSGEHWTVYNYQL